MDEQRTITLHPNAVEMTQIIESTSRAEVFNALGYLAQWNQTFKVVDIFTIDPDGQHGAPEFQAIYRRERNGPVDYLIAAVWNADSKQFGFHS